MEVQDGWTETQPDCVVEAGTKWGGSAALQASLLEFLEPDAKVIWIDITNMSAEACKHPAAVKRVLFEAVLPIREVARLEHERDVRDAVARHALSLQVLTRSSG